jgi:putative transposase
MKKASVAVRKQKKCKVTNNSNYKQPVFENLLQRQF